jgi:alcohol dehydrogenase class IV
MQFNIEGFEEKFARMAKALGIKNETGQGVVDYLFDLNDRLGIPKKLSGIGVKPEHLDTLADLAFADFAHPNNPKPVSRKNFKLLYETAL